jgi:hypothetical protein
MSGSWSLRADAGHGLAGNSWRLMPVVGGEASAGPAGLHVELRGTRSDKAKRTRAAVLPVRCTGRATNSLCPALTSCPRQHRAGGHRGQTRADGGGQVVWSAPGGAACSQSVTIAAVIVAHHRWASRASSRASYARRCRL